VCWLCKAHAHTRFAAWAFASNGRVGGETWEELGGM